MEQRKNEGIDDGGFVEDAPPPPPPSQKVSGFSMGGQNMKTAIISVVVTFGMLALMSFAGGVFFVTQQDFTANVGDVVEILDQAKLDLAKVKSDATVAVQAAIANIPATISSQINTAVANSVGALTNQVTALSTSLNTVNQQVQGTSAYVLESREMIKALEKRIAELEGDTIVSDISDVTRWVFKGERIIYSSITPIPPTVLVYVDDIDPSRIEKEGLYDIVLTIENNGTAPWTMGSMELELILEPRDYVPINEDDTYLDSDNYPWLAWDADFSIKTREGEDICRRITFTSDRYNFNYTLVPNEKYEIDLVLELYYD